jgi:hypothetical protein
VSFCQRFLNIITLFRLSACGPAVWTSTENTRAYGGVETPSATTVDACKAACLATTDCKGFDFNTLGASVVCYLFIGTIGTTEALTGVNHYVLIDACPPIGKTFSSFHQHLQTQYLKEPPAIMSSFPIATKPTTRGSVWSPCRVMNISDSFITP